MKEVALMDNFKHCRKILAHATRQEEDLATTKEIHSAGRKNKPLGSKFQKGLDYRPSTRKVYVRLLDRYLGENRLKNVLFPRAGPLRITVNLSIFLTQACIHRDIKVQPLYVSIGCTVILETCLFCVLSPTPISFSWHIHGFCVTDVHAFTRALKI